MTSKNSRALSCHDLEGIAGAPAKFSSPFFLLEASVKRLSVTLLIGSGAF
jgi:hypothetical protein